MDEYEDILTDIDEFRSGIIRLPFAVTAVLGLDSKVNQVSRQYVDDLGDTIGPDVFAAIEESVHRPSEAAKLRVCFHKVDQKILWG